MYIFKHENPALIPGTQHKMGTPHAMEITYKFYNVPQPGPAERECRRRLMTISRPESVKAAHNMAEMWSTFARTGKPAAKGSTGMAGLHDATRATMEIDADCKVVNDPYRWSESFGSGSIRRQVLSGCAQFAFGAIRTSAVSAIEGLVSQRRN